MNKENRTEESKPGKAIYTLPFFCIMAVLTLVAFNLSLRPNRSLLEKRELATFPEYSWTTLLSGDYFDDISYWFADTFPGREGWLEAASGIRSLYGYSEISISRNANMEQMLFQVTSSQGDAAPDGEAPPEEPTPLDPDPQKSFTEEPVTTTPSETMPTEAPEQQSSSIETIQAETSPAEPTVRDTAPTETTAPETFPSETTPTEKSMEELPEEETEPVQTAPEETAWGGVDAGEEEGLFIGDAIIQIGDSAFNTLGFSEQQSARYQRILSEFAGKVADLGVRVVSAPSPTAIGIMVEEKYLERLQSVSQEKILEALHGGMDERVITVDTCAALLAHNSEYIYFRTDHHWTALGAYYSYQAICEALGMEWAPLDSFQEWDQGVFEGSLFWKVSRPKQLRADDVIAYIPPGDIQMLVYNNSNYGVERPLLADMTQREKNSKYVTFISSDNPLSVITNHSLPEGKNCILVKDSFGNCMAPFLTQNYHKVFVVDYRKFYALGLTAFVRDYDIQDVIFVPYMIATQSVDGNNRFEEVCR